MKQTIFISHATPEDNDFSRWLALQLIKHGYNVWVDLLQLKGGERWWSDIEAVLRKETCKFLLVLSRTSNHRPGVEKEYAVAEKVASQGTDRRFIIPLHIDRELYYSDYNININALNSINFKDNWAAGLKALLDILEEDGVPKSEEMTPTHVSNWWNREVLSKEAFPSEDIHESNWFPVLSLPEFFYVHRVPKEYLEKQNLYRIPYAVQAHEGGIATFLNSEELRDVFSELAASDIDSVRLPLSPVLAQRSFTDYKAWFKNEESARVIVVALLNKAFNLTLRQRGLRSYLMSHQPVFYFVPSILKNSRVGRIKLIGKAGGRNWHYALSPSFREKPFPLFCIKAHVVFSDENGKLIESDAVQHSARRSFGKSWWNPEWRDHLKASATFLSKGKDVIELSCSPSTAVTLSSESLKFISDHSYTEPSKQQEAEIIDDELPENEQ